MSFCVALLFVFLLENNLWFQLFRVSSCKVYSAVAPPQQVYSAVPPPQLLLAGVQNSGNELPVNESSAAGLTSSTVSFSPAFPFSSLKIPGLPPVVSQGTVPQSGGYLNCGQSQGNVVGYSHHLLSRGTSYNGYGGIYPQTTPLQQVALALRQSPSPVTSETASTTPAPNKESKSTSDPEKEKRPLQKRKFQELPATSKCPAKPHQVSVQSRAWLFRTWLLGILHTFTRGGKKKTKKIGFSVLQRKVYFPQRFLCFLS